MASHEQDNCAQNPEAERSGMMPQIIDAVTKFDDFTEDNDPHGEHDFGMVTVLGHKVFWKIDYYDATLEYGSPDPADAIVTTRVLTIMLAHEY